MKIDAAVRVEKLFPRGGANAFRRRCRIFPLCLFDLPVEQHFLDSQMLFTAGNFGVDPRIAAQHFDLAIDLLMQHGQYSLARRRKNLNERRFVLNLRRETVAKLRIETKTAGKLAPGFVIKLLRRLLHLRQNFEHPIRHVGFFAEHVIKRGFRSVLACKRLVHERLQAVKYFLGKRMLAFS